MTGLLASTSRHDPTPLETLACLYFSNMLWLVAMLTVVVFWFSSEIKVIKGYVLVSALSDFTPWAGITYALKLEAGAWDAANWSYVTPDLRAQILVPVATFSIKLGYLLGLFGQDRAPQKKTI
ncbi:hypothetical protein PV05_10789 [Exophiala xenobiotica]|uniref:DUF7704 domain-containing protein n=1 Tax=Exophiala xenobiotica TaxID=348802 RepID=A0A0D2E2W7_9EURO|nr:uncharacterized protein PV05_10789 [Exophiala xenobiotica]KIW49075.1 hypothetical protein PV05_10789 [Exophiala xenobiotica]